MGLTFTAGNHRYKLDGKPVTGVTTILGGGVPKPALVWWAGGVVAKFVADPGNAGKLAELLAGDYESAVKYMQLLPNRERDAAGERGTEVHDLAENLIQGGSVEAPEDLVGFLMGYADFLDEWQVTPVLVERIVANRTHWYSGKFDLFATSPLLMSQADIDAGRVVQIDLKTSKGVYPETGLQTAAYSRADFYMGDDGKETPLPEVVKTFVAHVTPMDREGINARYEGSPLGTTLYQLAGSTAEIDEHFQQFLNAKAVFEDAKTRGKIILEPMELPTLSQVAA